MPFLEFGKRQFVTITKLANGDLYEGQWNTEGKRDGFGYCLIENGTAIYEGYWQNGNMHGPGRLTNKMGHYKGDFQSNTRQGFGMYKFRTGDWYEGDWINGLKNGYGKSYNKAEDRIYDG